MTVPFDFGFWTRDETPEPFVPTEADLAGVEFCEVCGAELDSNEECMNSRCPLYEGDYDNEGDFPLAMEYEGAYGLSGYDSFYDNDSDLMHEW
jgi:hypothetical protein